MTLRFTRRIVVALLAFYAFGQAGVALAACGMDRGAMAQAMAMPAGETCGDCASSGTDSVSALCVAHCAADLQIAGTAPDAAVAPPIAGSMLVAPPRFGSPPVVTCLPPAAPPRRILLHSFQV